MNTKRMVLIPATLAVSAALSTVAVVGLMASPAIAILAGAVSGFVAVESCLSRIETEAM